MRMTTCNPSHIIAVLVAFLSSVEFWDTFPVAIIELLLGSRIDDQVHVTASAAHNLMEVFTATLSYDPQFVVRSAAATCRAAQRFSYEFDSMASAQVVKFVELILADHRELLRNSEIAKSVSEILDIFIQAGWASAVQLVMRLDVALR